MANLHKFKEISFCLAVLLLSSCQPQLPPDEPIVPTTFTQPTSVHITPKNFSQLKLSVSGTISFPHEIVWAQDSQTITAAADGSASLLDAQTLEIEKVFSYEVPASLSAASPDGKTVAFSDDNQNIGLFDLTTANKTLTIHPDYFIGRIDFSPDGRRMLTTSQEDLLVTLWDTNSGDVLKTLSGFDTAAPVYTARFGDDGEHIVWVSRGRIQLTNIESGEMSMVFDHEDFIVSWALSHDGKYLATASAGMVQGHFVPLILIWDTDSGETRMLMNSESSYDAVTFCPNTHLVAIAQENLITIIDLDEFCKPAELTLSGGSITDMAFAPDGSALAAVNADGLIALWRIPN